MRRMDIAGYYLPNHFIIEFPAHSPYLAASEGPAQQFTPLFMHEYWHFLHNVTTIAGYRSFILTQSITMSFSRTLKGRDSAISLKDDQAAFVATLFDLIHAMDGAPRPKNRWSEKARLFSVLDILEKDRTFTDESKGEKIQKIIELAVEGVASNGCTYKGKFEFGSIAIEESIAWMVEEKFRTENGFNAVLPPPFPYRSVERVLKGLAPSLQVSPYFCAALGTLALGYNSPGTAFIALARKFIAEFESTKSENDSLNNVLALARPNMLHLTKIARQQLLELERSVQGLGLWPVAVKYICDLLRKGFDRRDDDPLFDIKAVFLPSKENNPGTLHNDFPPCDVLQEADDGGKMLWGFHPSNKADVTPSDLMRILQSQQHFVFSHMDRMRRKFLLSSRVVGDPPCNTVIDRSCPYLDACPHPFMAQNTEVCGVSPWRACAGDDRHCWYSVAVQGVMGLTGIPKKRTEP